MVVVETMGLEPTTPCLQIVIRRIHAVGVNLHSAVDLRVRDAWETEDHVVDTTIPVV